MKKYHIDKAHSWMIGDAYTDMLAGRSAGVKTAFAGDYKCDVCGRLDFVKPDLIGKDLAEIAERILEG